MAHTGEQNSDGIETVTKLSQLVNSADNGVSRAEEEDGTLGNYIRLFLLVPLSDHVSLLFPVVELLKANPSGESILLQCKICDMFCRVICGEQPGIREKFGKWKEIIADKLTSPPINIFKTIENFMTFPASNHILNNRKVSASLNLIAVILNCNTYVKKSFDESFGVMKLREDLMLYNSLDTGVGEALLELMTVLNKGNIVITERVITIQSLVTVMVELIPLFDDTAQQKICESIRIMCASVLQNRLTCCHNGLISDILKLLGKHGKQLNSSIKDCLISIMEILGCLSITSAEIKLLIGLFRNQTAGNQFTHADRLVQSLERMASQNVMYHTQYQPQCFINFYNVYSPTSVRCPSITQWNGKGITVHTWICMDFTLPNTLECGKSKVRHVLYCFLNTRGEGFEAFFSEDGFLVLAVHTKKEFLTTTVASSPFMDQEWHGVTIVHTKRLLGRATVTVYVDGQEIHNTQLQYPLPKEITHSYIGQGVRSNSNFHYENHAPSSTLARVMNEESTHPQVIAAGLQNQVWGIPSSLKGQMSSFVLFNESLTAEKIQELSLPGPNYKHLFTSKLIHSEPQFGDTSDLYDYIVFYFDAKASCGDQIIDLYPSYREKTVEASNLRGSIHHVWSIQDSIQSLGGLAVLFPLLEQACCHKNSFNVEQFYDFLDGSVEAPPLKEEADTPGCCEGSATEETVHNLVGTQEELIVNGTLGIAEAPPLKVEMVENAENKSVEPQEEVIVSRTLGTLVLDGTEHSRCSSDSGAGLLAITEPHEQTVTSFKPIDPDGACSSKVSNEEGDSGDEVRREKVSPDVVPETLHIITDGGETVTLTHASGENDGNKDGPNCGDLSETNVTNDLDEECTNDELTLLQRSCSKNTFDVSSPGVRRSTIELGSVLKLPLRKSDENMSGSRSSLFSPSRSESPADMPKMKKVNSLGGSNDWTLVDMATSPITRSDTFKSWAKQDNNHQSNGVTHFISLIRYMIGSHKHGKDMFVDLQAIKVIGLLLQTCNPDLINIGFLHSVAQLVESIIGMKEDLLKAVYEHVVFEFKIWHRAHVSVQIAHTQLLHTYIKDDPTLFNGLFGVGFFFRIIELYYCRVRSDSKVEKCALSKDEARDLRKALLGLILYMLKLSPSTESLNCVVSYLANLSLHKHIDEVVDILLNIVKMDDLQLNSYLADSGSYVFYRWMVHEIPDDIRIKILTIISQLLHHNTATVATTNTSKLPEHLRDKLLLQPNVFPAVGELLCKQSDMSREVIVQLTKLALSQEKSVELEADIYTDFCVMLTVVRVAQCLPRPIKLEVAIKIRSSLKLCPMSVEHCAGEPAWYDPLWRLILTENNSPQDVGVMEAELVQVVVEIIYITMWSGIKGSDQAAWARRCEPLNFLQYLASESSTSIFLLPVFTMERQIFEFCLEAAARTLKKSEKLLAGDTENAVQILRLVEDFLCSTELQFADEEHHKWSERLVNNLFELLNVMNAWSDSTEDGTEWVEVIEIVERILYKGCMQEEDPSLLILGSKYLVRLLNKHPVRTREEACFQLYHLNTVLKKLIVYEQNYENLLCAMYPRYEMCCAGNSADDEDAGMKQLPFVKISSFKKDYVWYMDSEDFQHFVEETVKPLWQAHTREISSGSLDVGRLWMDSLNAMQNAMKSRQMGLEEALQSFSKDVYGSFEEKRSAEQNTLEEYKKSQRQKNGISKKLWEYQKRFLTSQRGAWRLSDNKNRYFKLSNTENRYRMRLKLTENLKFNAHTDAARQRDLSTTSDHVVAADKSPLQLQLSHMSDITEAEDIEEKLSPNAEDDEEGSEGEDEGNSSHLYDLQAFDKITGSCIHHCESRLVTLMDVVAGRIELTATHVCFYDDKDNSLDATYDFNFSLDELREIYSRRYNLRKTAMEFFLLDRSSFFVNFPSAKDKEVFYRKLINQKPKHLYYSGIQTPSKLLRVSRLTTKWVEREISNFEYLMQLNTISGRTYNDLAQYPVFPWVITDYTSETIDLDDESLYRDLTKPVGVLNPKKAEEIQIRYENFVDLSGMTQKSHYFTHYSNPGGVLHYLVRVEPFTSLHIHLQSGKFDCADRLFYALATSWESVMAGSDVMELIPEFYFFPEFLMNLNHFNLGRLQNNGEDISNVRLPPWAKDAYEFISIHRQALESEHVSANLHNWIDLIFGYKQRGKEAEKAMNVFSHYSYEEAVDLDQIDDPILREATEGMINNFGQTPTQLLKRPHPKRKTLKEIEAGRPLVINQLESSTFSLIEILHMVNPLIFISTCKPRPKSILYQAVPDSLITVHANGLFGTHAWYTDPKTNSFSFTMDVLLASASSHSQRHLPGAISPSVEYSSRLFAFTTDGHLMISCGYWDSTIRLVNIDRGKDRLKACVSHHNDIVTCISLDADGSHLISGSADLTCAVWKIEQVNGFSAGLSRKPIQLLYGHDSCITAVGMHGDLDLAASGAMDGTCLIHTIRKGIFVHSLKPTLQGEGDILSEVVQLKISDQGRIIVLSKIVGADNTRHFISMYSINGAALGSILLNQFVCDICIVEDYIVIGSMCGTLQIRHTNDLSCVVLSKNVKAPIYTVAATHNGSHIFIGRSDGNILVMCPSKV